MTTGLTKTTQKVEELDTEESLEYMGSALLFQVKKRLNLTTKEEEDAEKKKKKATHFNIFGIKIEQN